MHEGHCHKHFSWFPVIIGGLVGLGLAFLFNIFSVAISMSVFTTDPQGAKMIALGGLIGLLIGTIATMFTAGFTAGHLAGTSDGEKNYGVIYGFAAWCLALILTALLASSLGRYVASYADFIGQPRVMEVVSQLQETAKNVSNQTNPTVSSKNTETEKNIKAIGMGSFLMFILFFVGAFSASLGGYMGVECWKKCKMMGPNTTCR